jgi:hypothetical protein
MLMAFLFPVCSASALNVVNIGGVFVVLLCGLSVAILVAIVEFCWKARKMNTESHPMLGQVIITQQVQYYFIHSHETISLRTYCGGLPLMLYRSY